MSLDVVVGSRKIQPVVALLSLLFGALFGVLANLQPRTQLQSLFYFDLRQTRFEVAASCQAT
jgi:hypothetical protein